VFKSKTLNEEKGISSLGNPKKKERDNWIEEHAQDAAPNLGRKKYLVSG